MTGRQIEKRTIAGKNIYSIGYGLLQICLDDQITADVVREMVNHKPEEMKENSLMSLIQKLFPKNEHL